MASKITIYRGRTYDFTYNHTNTVGAAVALTGCTVYFTVKSAEHDTDADDSDALIQKTVTSHTNAAGGISGWTLDDADTYITPGKYHYDVIVEDADGLSEPPSLFGDFVVKGTPTNRNVGNE